MSRPILLVFLCPKAWPEPEVVGNGKRFISPLFIERSPGATSSLHAISSIIPTVDDEGDFFRQATVLTLFNSCSTLKDFLIIFLFEVKFINSFLDQLLDR